MQEKYTLIEFAKALKGFRDKPHVMPHFRHCQIDECDVILHYAPIIHQSMTQAERENLDLLTPSRCQRIASGSGTPWTVQGRVLLLFMYAREVDRMVGKMTINEKMLWIQKHFGGESLDDDDEVRI